MWSVSVGQEFEILRMSNGDSHAEHCADGLPQAGTGPIPGGEIGALAAARHSLRRPI